MKKPLYILLLFLCSVVSVPSFAQGSYFAQQALSGKDQQFNRPLSPKPYIGMDLVRLYFPKIIVQVSDGQVPENWINKQKFTTYRTSFSQDIFEELGTYYWKDASGWIPEKVSRFSINYNQTRKSVMGAMEQRSFALQMTQVIVSYSFNNNNQVDTEKMILNGAVYLTKFEYNAQGKLISATQSKEGSDTWISTYTYDQNNRITEELLIRKKIFLSEPDSVATEQNKRSLHTVSDSITKEQYEYDVADRVTRRASYTYDKDHAAWKLLVINEYAYDQEGRLKEDHIWSLLNEVMTASGHNTYTYTATGKPDTLISTYLDSLHHLQGYKVKIFYDGLDEAAMAFQFAYTGSGFENKHSQRWVFFEKNVTGVDDAAGEEALHIYPNPCKDLLSLPVDKGVLKIWDMSGREVHRVSLSSNQVDVSFLQTGFYYVSINDSKPVKLIRE